MYNMIIHTQQEKRVERIELIFDFLEKNSGKPVNVEKIFKEFDWISRRTIQDYLKTLLSSGRIKYNQFGWFVESKEKNDVKEKNIFDRFQ